MTAFQFRARFDPRPASAGKNIRKLIERFKVSDISIDQSGRGGAAPPSSPSSPSGSDADAEGEAPPAPAAAQVVITYTVEQEAAAREAQTYIAAMVTDPAKGDVFTACKVPLPHAPLQLPRSSALCIALLSTNQAISCAAVNPIPSRASESARAHASSTACRRDPP